MIQFVRLLGTLLGLVYSLVAGGAVEAQEWQRNDCGQVERVAPEIELWHCGG